MTKLASRMVALASASMLSGTAIANPSMVGPTYIGDRSANDEQETYAYLVPVGSERLLGFVGPARTVGIVTGNPERDTIAYRPLLAVQANCL